MEPWTAQQSSYGGNFLGYDEHTQTHPLSSTDMERTLSDSTTTTQESSQSWDSDNTTITYYEDGSVDESLWHGTSDAASFQQLVPWHEEGMAEAFEYCPSDHFDAIIGDIESSARLVSNDAMLQLQWGYKPAGTFITDEAIMKRVEDLGSAASEREAVQQIVHEGLRDFFLDGNTDLEESAMGMLREAAYYIQSYAGGLGEEPFEICRMAIVLTLMHLRAYLQGEPLDTPQQLVQYTPDKSKFTCDEPGCRGKPFGRAADLQRHHQNVHLDASKRKQFLCDYRKCPRHKLAFNRADHFRDHLRDFHREDLVRRSVKPDSEFWRTRSAHALFGGWWRCGRCFKRVALELNGFTCQCVITCEPERQKYRSTSQFAFAQKQYLESGKSSA
ncbi:hypothetical protein OQA88_9792 [Cercophora sp. LCS_1]